MAEDISGLSMGTDDKEKLPIEAFRALSAVAADLSDWEAVATGQYGERLPGYMAPSYAGMWASQRDINIDLVAKCWKTGFLGVDPYITRQVMPLVAAVAQTLAPVLITGENGTGKEVVAKSIHELSCRESKPFVAVNCAGIPKDLLESELFGHEEGAFTGAKKRKRGLVEEAEGGTLFLDEVGDMPVELQAVLLRFLNDREYRLVGGTKAKKADVRIISATNRDLKEQIKEKTFRQDLYFRLESRQIHLWPLCLRPGDILLLMYYFLSQFNIEHPETPIQAVGVEAVREAMSSRWDGNVRELRGSIERNCELTVFANQEALWHLDSVLYDEYDLQQLESRQDLFEKGQYIEDLLSLDLKRDLKDWDRILKPSYRGRWKFSDKVRRVLAEKGDGNVDPIELIGDVPFSEIETRYAQRLLAKCENNATAAGRIANKDAKTLKAWAKRGGTNK